MLSGGSALGAYQAGVYEALHGAGLRPDFISGGSAGAINGALIAGNAPDERVARLRDYWRPSSIAAADDGAVDDWRRTLAVQTAMIAGRADTFTQRGLLGLGWPFEEAAPSVLDTGTLGAAMERLVDFERLNGGTPRFSVAAVDLETGEDVIFDTVRDRFRPDHIRASAALLPAFPPVEIDGRLLADAGISANLPLDVVLRDLADERLLVIAVDLLPLAGLRPRTVTEAASRLQDLNFATQSRRAIDFWRRIFAERLACAGKPVPTVTLVHLIYADQHREVVGKAFDFSPATLRDRWDKGARDATAMLAMLRDGSIGVTDSPGLHVHRVEIGVAHGGTG